MSVSRIDSPSNPTVKEWLALSDRKARDATGTFLVEGQRETARLAGHCEVVTHIVCGDADTPMDAGTVVVSERVFRKISRRQNPDGVAAVLRTPNLAPWSLATEGTGLMLVADGVQKPGNIGAMIRTADAFNAPFVGSSLGTDLVNPNVIRASQGSLFAHRTASADRGDIIRWLDDAGVRAVVTSPDADQVLWDTDLAGRVAIVIGAEDVGAHSKWQHADRITIPMAGTADSLNASVTAGIMLAEAVRQRTR